MTPSDSEPSQNVHNQDAAIGRQLNIGVLNGPLSVVGAPVDPSLQHAEQLRREYLKDLVQQLDSDLEAATLIVRARDTPEHVIPPIAKLARIHVPPSLLQLNRKFRTTAADAGTRASESHIFGSFAEAFELHKGRTLLLGEPGSGKTTTLLQFALVAAENALKRPDSPIPVWQSISLEPRWDGSRPLRDWALSDLKEKCAGIDLDSFPVLYIFDGLDELGGERPADSQKQDGEKCDPRVSFLKAVEEQLRYASVVISCRRLDYEELSRKAIIQGAVTLLPLEPEQIRDFLNDRGQAPLWPALAADKQLLELARTPLLLSLLSLAVGEQTGDVHIGPSLTSTASTIFDFYIHQRFVHEASKRVLPFDEVTTRVKLAKLAGHMWREPWDLQTELEAGIVENLLGSEGNAFLVFACSMHFTRPVTEQKAQFIHLQFRDYCAVPALIDLLTDENENVRLGAVISLGLIQNPSTVPALIEALGNKDRNVRFHAALVFGRVKDATAMLALIEALSDEDRNVRCAVADALGEIKHASAVPALIVALSDEDGGVRCAVAHALGQIKDASSVPALIEALKVKDVGSFAADALGEIRDVSAVPALIESLRDKYKGVRSAAAGALEKIKNVS